MRAPPEDVEEVKFAMAPMIDMVFLLLIFFMCASHVSRNQTLKLEIPVASKGVVPKDRPDRWVVNVTQDGSIFSGSDPVGLEDLKNLVSARLKAEPGLKVYVRADQKTPHKSVKRVMNAMAESGVADFIFGVFTPQSSKPREGGAP